MAILAHDFDRGGNFAVDVTGAVVILGKVTIDAMHTLVEVDRRHVHGFLELLRIVVRDHITLVVEQVALAIATENGSKVPAMTVIIGKLGVVQLRVHFADLAQKLLIDPLAPRRRTFRVFTVGVVQFIGGRIFLFLRPHKGRVGLVIPHGVAEIGVNEHVRLVHVTAHALAGRNRARKAVGNRVPFLGEGNGWIDGARFAAVPGSGIGAGMAWITVIGVNGVTTGTAGMAIVARIVVGAHKPHVRIIEASLGNVDDWHCDTATGTRPAVGLFEVGAPRFFEALDLPELVGNAGFRK